MSFGWWWIIVGSFLVGWCLLLSPIKVLLCLPFLAIGIRYLCELGYLSLAPSRIAVVLLIIPSLALRSLRALLDPTLPLKTSVSPKTILILDAMCMLSLLVILIEWKQQV